MGATIGTYDVIKFDDTGVSSVSAIDLALFNLYYPFMTIGDFEFRKNSNFSASGDKFNSGILSINEFGTELSENITSTTNVINVSGTTGFPQQGHLYIGNEIISYTGKTPTSFTGVIRGSRNTTAKSHNLDQYIRSVN